MQFAPTRTFFRILVADYRCSFAAMLFGRPCYLGYGNAGQFAPLGQTATRCTWFFIENLSDSALFFDWHALCINHRARE
jgi:hypothetical protein